MPDEKAPSSGAFLPLSLMYFLSGEPMHYLSGVDTTTTWPVGRDNGDRGAEAGHCGTEGVAIYVSHPGR